MPDKFQKKIECHNTCLTSHPTPPPPHSLLLFFILLQNNIKPCQDIYFNLKITLPYPNGRPLCPYFNRF